MSIYKLGQHMHIAFVLNRYRIKTATGAITRYDFHSLSFSIISQIVDTMACSAHCQIRVHETSSVHCFLCTSFRIVQILL